MFHREVIWHSRMRSRLQLLSKNAKNPQGSVSAFNPVARAPSAGHIGPCTSAHKGEKGIRGTLEPYRPTAPSHPSSWSLDQLTSLSTFLPCLSPPLFHCTQPSWATVSIALPPGHSGTFSSQTGLSTKAGHLYLCFQLITSKKTFPCLPYISFLRTYPLGSSTKLLTPKPASSLLP